MKSKSKINKYNCVSKIPKGIYNFCITSFEIKNGNFIKINFKIMNKDNKKIQYDLQKKFTIYDFSNSWIFKCYKKMFKNVIFSKLDLKRFLGVSGVCEIKYSKLDYVSNYPQVFIRYINREESLLNNNYLINTISHEYKI
ncbi:hypothetical protein [Clostridium tyrobutyricum]|uniref:hypothetical protein n=1 Tax=Clostridium tyrobutyricum TaxID=1519 RepID=UPI001C386909|nr:hypothetical protein [Clostridium tyrobutyricum]MBV4429543.1 hypothetical protein [Clostridium tyrobutyricum]MBV4444764.1 hypothetical protein [Clostridium tyrobutyricum]